MNNSQNIFILATIIMMVLADNMCAQSVNIKWCSDTKCEIGNVTDTDGDVVRSFLAKNTGEYGWKICNAYTSCGCTKVEYDNEKLVRSGDSIIVTLRFNPKGKTGSVEEKATIVFTDGEIQRNEYLSLKGSVIVSAETQKLRHPFDMGDDVFSSKKVIDFGEISINDEPTQLVSLWDGKEAKSLEVRWKKQQQYGLQEQSVKISRSALLMKAVVLPDVKNLTEIEKQNAPVALISNIIQKDKDEIAGVTIKNVGKSELHILSLGKVEILGNIKLPVSVKPGDDFIFKIKTSDARVMIITNDVKRPRQSIRIKK